MMPLDLNLLAIFDALYDLRSVTRSAERLNLTQSAVSHALRRLRDAVGDPLFVRGGRMLQPTARAVQMAPAIREGLAQLRRAMASPGFDPAGATRVFTIAAGSYFCALTVPRLMAHGRAAAPGVTFRIVAVDSGLLAELDEGTIDLALGAFGQVPDRLRAQALFHDELVWIAARNHPLHGRRASMADILAQPRLQVGVVRPFGVPQALLASGGLEFRAVSDTMTRRSGQGDAGMDRGVVYDSLTAATIVGETDLLALIPRRIAEIDAERLGVAILETERHPLDLELTMLWHGRFDDDPGLRWLRETLAAL